MENIKKSAELINNSHNILVLTGAGMSTESGIPDFRSNTGIYKGKFQGADPEEILSLTFFKSRSKVFWEFIREYMTWKGPKPNEGHNILAKWEREGRDLTICTQNIDGLHTRAGSKKVIEVHGTMETATCQNPHCRKKYKLKDIIEDEEGYRCSCGGYIKPDIVLYEEAVDRLEDAFIAMEKADLLIVLGTSLNVYPVAEIPAEFSREGKPVIIINKTETRYNNYPGFIEIHEGIGDTLKKINEELSLQIQPMKIGKKL